MTLASPELRWIYDTAPIGLAFLSPDCRYLQINQRLTDICGISVEDHLGRTVREMVPNLADAGRSNWSSRIVANGEPVTGIEVNGQRADGVGADRCWLTNWYPLKGPDGRVLGVNVAAEEITERKRAQAARRRERGALSRAGAGDVVAGVDRDRGWTVHRVAGMVRLHRAIAREMRRAWAGSTPCTPTTATPRAISGKRARQNSAGRSRSNTASAGTTASMSGTRTRGNAVLEADGSVREWVGVCVDIDERKAAAEQRETFHRSVEQALQLLVSVSAAASAALTTSELAQQSLERICSAQRWQFGQVWYPDAASGRLHLRRCGGLERLRISPTFRRTSADNRDRARRRPAGPGVGDEVGDLVRGLSFVDLA